MEAMQEAGFVDLGTKDLRLPLRDWPEDKKEKEIGILCAEATLGDLESKYSRIGIFSHLKTAGADFTRLHILHPECDSYLDTRRIAGLGRPYACAVPQP